MNGAAMGVDKCNKQVFALGWNQVIGKAPKPFSSLLPGLSSSLRTDRIYDHYETEDVNHREHVNRLDNVIMIYHFHSRQFYSIFQAPSAPSLIVPQIQMFPEQKFPLDGRVRQQGSLP
ncbi:hypothetical protein Mapa_012137 [Marchantia paleacea]|nr:hypothetical protein Mapa_012137 [Marchantia paleacea]